MVKILKFLGCGSAFNPDWGNTSAYFTLGNKLVLIDCGELIFSKLYDMKILNAYDEINIIITHTHADHIGSLGSVISYSYYVLNKRVVIIHPNDSVAQLLDRMGIHRSTYIWEMPKSLQQEDLKIEEIPVKHADDLLCYGYLISIEGKCIYYSGDSYEMAESVVHRFINGDIEEIYQDTTEFESDHLSHYPIEKLGEIIPEECRKRMYCMHFSNDFSDKIRKFGFGNIKDSMDIHVGSKWRLRLRRRD